MTQTDIANSEEISGAVSVSIVINSALSDSSAIEMEKQNITIGIPPASVSDDEAFVTVLAYVVNTVYSEAEEGIFKPGYVRTSTEEIAKLLRAGNLVVASVPTRTPASTLKPSSGRTPLGCICIRKLSETRAELGLFAVMLEQRGRGLGRDLIAFAEKWCRDQLGGPDIAIAQVDLLWPTYFEHLFKVRLDEWYNRRGYQIVGRLDFATEYPKLAPLLAGPVEYRVYEKKL